MNETGDSTNTFEDFSEICRICLEVHEHMINIFDSGIDSQLVEVTNIKVMLDDNLPKVLCQTCQSKVHQYFNFLQQAKSSDNYLRSKLLNKNNSFFKNPSAEKQSTKLDNQTAANSQVSKTSTKEDFMYLILVSKEENNRDVYMKELNYEISNIELNNLCKNYIETHLSGYTYLNTPVDIIEKPLESKLKIYKVNLDIYKCNECGKGFEDLEDLMTNCGHNESLSILNFNYNCPICGFTEKEKENFLRHLKSHVEEGVVLVKTASNEDEVATSDFEKCVFESEVNNESDCSIFLLNLNNFICEMCGNSFESKELITQHVHSCSLKKNVDFEFLIKYTCPVCNCEYDNDENNYILHLKSHKNNNIHFINVNNHGVPVNVDEHDLFLPYQEGIEVLKVFEGKIFKILDANSCEECDFIAKSFQMLCEHYKSFHNLKELHWSQITCPVCSHVFLGNKVDEFYKHLRKHKSEGFSFVLVNKNNALVKSSAEYFDIFTYSKAVLSILNHSSQSFDIMSPEIHSSKKEASFSCDICHKSLKRKKEMIKHMKSHFNEKSKYICEKCGKKCKGKWNYKKHFMNHFAVEMRRTCRVCNKTFAKRATLHGHIRQHIKEGTFKEETSGIICEKCGKSFSSNAGLTKHKKLHLKNQESVDLKCEICGRDFISEASFERHKSAHFNPKYFECEVCKLPLPSLTSLQKHSLVHKTGSGTFDCKTCKISFLTKDSLTAHQAHTGHYGDRAPLECNVCHEKFFVGRKFTEHTKTHPKYKVGECTLCGKRLATIQSLMLHMSRHFESHSILCPHCGKQFFEEGNYHRHLLTHKGIKPFSCDIESCEKSFYTLSELNRHKRYHNNTRDFRCTYCSKSFHEANHLTVHIRTHTGERPYICPHCNKGFITRTRCKQHIKLVHQGIGYDLIRSNISKKVTVFEAIAATA